MRRILAIFRKDTRHLWPQAAAVSLLMAVAAVLDPTYSGRLLSYYYLLPSFALPLTCWLLIISAIHQEKLPGNRQYWLTRPYSRWELAAAKVLFVAAFVNFPLLAYHLCVYAALGIPIADHLGALLWGQVFFTAFYILPAAGLGAITRSLGRALATALAGGVAFWIVGVAFMIFARHSPPAGQPPASGAANVFTAVVLMVGVAAILAVQYAWRRTAIAGTLAVAVAAAVLSPNVYPRAYGRQVSDAPKESVELSLDPAPEGRGEMPAPGDPDLAAFDIPVRVNGLPSGEQLERTYLNVAISPPNSRYILRATQAQLYGLHEGRGWLSFTIERYLPGHTPDTVIVSGSFNLRLFRIESVSPLPKGSPVVVPGVGACRDSRDEKGEISFTCYSPFPRAVLMAGIPGHRFNWIVSPGLAAASIPLASGFQPVTKYLSLLSYRGWSEVGDMKLIAAQPLQPVRVTFQFPVSLREYLVTGDR